MIAPRAGNKLIQKTIQKTTEIDQMRLTKGAIGFNDRKKHLCCKNDRLISSKKTNNRLMKQPETVT